jgi:large subunit ribosomal protein L13
VSIGFAGQISAESVSTIATERDRIVRWNGGVSPPRSQLARAWWRRRLSRLPDSTGNVEMRTYTPKKSDIQREWHVVDADGKVLGRLCTEVARVLRGKHKPIFAPHIDTGDHVIIVNAAKVVMTSNKAERERVYRHSGYPGGIKSDTYAELLAKKPEELVRRSVRGMLPKGPLGRQMLTKLKVYAGPDHPHAAQSPTALEI